MAQMKPVGEKIAVASCPTAQIQNWNLASTHQQLLTFCLKSASTCNFAFAKSLL